MISLLDRIDEFLAQFLDEMAKLLTRPDDLFYKEPEFLTRKTRFSYLESQILLLLKATYWLLSSKTFNKVYKSLDRILKILIICDDFEVLSQCMLLLYGYFSDDLITASDYAYMQQLEDLLFICKYALNHRNSFNSKANFLYTDFFQDDPKFFDFQEKIQKNMEANVFSYDSSLEIQFLLNNENLAISEGNLEEFALGKNLINSLEITLFLLNSHKLIPEIDFQWTSCKNKRLFYGLLYRVKFSRFHRSYSSRMGALSLILFALQTYVSLTKMFSLEKNELLNEIFVTNLNFGKILQEILNLFHLQLTPEFHTKVVFSILNILSLDDHFDFKEYMNQINNQFMFLQKLLKDCLIKRVSSSTSQNLQNLQNSQTLQNLQNPQISQNSQNDVFLCLTHEKPAILPEKTALNPRFLKKLLLLLKKEVKQFYLDEDNNVITTQIYSMCTLLSSLMEINDSPPVLYNEKTYFLYSYQHLLILNEILWNLIPNQDLLNNYNLFQKLIDRLQRDLTLFLTFTSNVSETSLVFSKNCHWEPLALQDIADFVEYMLKLIDSPFFRKISMRNQMVPSLARKIADSTILSLLKSVVESSIHRPFIEKIFLQIITLVGDISREIPTLIERLIERGIMKTLLLKLDDMPRNVEAIPMFIYFINMLCLNEIGQNLEISLDSLKKIFELFVRKDFIEVLGKNIGHNGNKCPSSMAYEFLEMLNSVEKLKPRVCELILWTFRQLIAIKEKLEERCGFGKNEKNANFCENEKNAKNAMLEENEENRDIFTNDFPLGNEGFLEGNSCINKECLENLKDFNRLLQNFLRFFSRFFTVNCNIIDELVAGHCIELFLSLMDCPLLIFSEKSTIFHSFSNCFKVLIMNSYKVNLNDKITEEILRVFTKFEVNFGRNIEKIDDFTEKIPEEILLFYYEKGLIDEKIAIKGEISILGDLFYLENLAEFLRLIVTSRHFHEEITVSNEGLLMKLSVFLRILMCETERLSVFSLKKEFETKEIFFEEEEKTEEIFDKKTENFEENAKKKMENFEEKAKKKMENFEKNEENFAGNPKEKNEKKAEIPKEDKRLSALKKVLSLNHPLFQIMKKVFVQNLKEIIDFHLKTKPETKNLPEILSIFVDLLLDCLNKEDEPFRILLNFDTEDQMKAFFNLFHHFHQLFAFKELFLAFFELFKKNAAFHPEFTLLFYRNFGFEKILSYLTNFLKILTRFLSKTLLKKNGEFPQNPLLLEMLRKVHTELVFIIKALFFQPLELGYRVLMPETGKLEENDSLQEFLDFITLSSLVSLQKILYEQKDLFLLVTISPEFKPVLEISIHLLIKGLKFTHHSQRKTLPRRKPGLLLIEDLVQMGFQRDRILEALENVENQTMTNLTEYLLSHPDNAENRSLETQKSATQKSEKIENFAKIPEKNLLAFSLKKLKNIGKEEFLKEKQRIYEEILEDFFEKLLFMQEFEKNIIEFLLSFLEKTENEALRKPIFSKFLYILLRGIKATSQSFLKKFNFKLGVKGNRDISDKIRNEGEFIKDLPPEVYSKIGIFPMNSFGKTLYNLNVFLPILLLISLKNSNLEKNPQLKVKPALEILKIAEKLLEKTAEIHENLAITQEFLLKVLILMHHTISSHERSRNSSKGKNEKKLKLRSNMVKNDEKASSEMKDLYNRLIPLIIQLFTIHNNEKTAFLTDSLFLGALNLLKNGLKNAEFSRIFLSKKGLFELLRLKDHDFKDFSEVFRKIIENLLINDEELASAHYELEIKRFFLEKKPVLHNEFRSKVPLNEFLSFVKELNPENFASFEEVSKRICLKRTAKMNNVDFTKISLRKENKDITRLFMRKPQVFHSQNLASSLYQPFPDVPLLFFNENGLLSQISFMESSSNEKISRKTCKKPIISKKPGKKPENTDEIPVNPNEILAIDFQPNEQISGVLSLILESILSQFLDEVSQIDLHEENPQKLVFSYVYLLKLLHAILHKFPILSPFILKFNCAKFLKKHEAVFTELFLPKNKEISFLTFLTKVLLPLTLDKFRHILFEICLDSYLFCPVEVEKPEKPNEKHEKSIEKHEKSIEKHEKSSEITAFSQEIRKKILLDVFLGFESELSLVRKAGISAQFHHKNMLIHLITLHLYLLPIKEIARLSLSFPLSSKFPLNFLRIYEELFKNLHIKDIYSLENRLDLLNQPLSILYQYLIAFLLNKKNLAVNSNNLMPVNLLSKKSSFSSEWELMMNPTVFFDNSLENSHIHLEETSSSSENDLSIDTFMNEIYQYRPENQNPEAQPSEPLPFYEEAEDFPLDENLEENIANPEELEENPLNSIAQESEISEEISEEIEENSENSEESEENVMNSPSSSSSSSSGFIEENSDNSSENEDIDEESLSSETISEEMGNRRNAQYFEAEESDSPEPEDSETEEDELVEMRSEREIALPGVESNRRRFLGSVNFIFRRDRLEREDRRHNRLRMRKNNDKKKQNGKISLNSITNFDYLSFDPEIQRINEQFLGFLQKFTVSTNAGESWLFSMKVQLYQRISRLEFRILTTKDLASNPDWTRLFPSNPPINPLANHAISSQNPQNHLNWDFLMNSGNGMVMFVSGRDAELMDLNQPANTQEIVPHRPEIANLQESLNARRLVFRDLFNDLRREQLLEPEAEIRESIVNLDAEETRDLNWFRDRLVRELSEEARDPEEEEKKETSNENQPIDPLFMHMLNEELKDYLPGIEDPETRNPRNSSNLPQNFAENRNFTENRNFAENRPFSFENPEENRENVNTGQNPSADIDNAYFFASLPPQLRDEVLQSSDPAFLGTLPAEILSEFQGLREQNARLLNANPLILTPESSSISSDSSRPKLRKIPFRKEKKGLSLHKQKEQLMKNPANSKILIVEEKILENIVNFLYVDSLAFRMFPYTLMKALMIHPVNEVKLLDCFMGLLKQELPTQEILERDCILQDTEKIFSNISLKILTILAVFTKNSISGFFLEKSHKSLICEKKDKNREKTPLQELIGLLANREFLNSYGHLKLLIAVIANISRKVKVFNEKKTDDAEKFSLEEESVVFLCNVLNSDILDEKSLKNLNNIISVFSLNKANLQSFVAQMKLILLGICEKMNFSLEENLVSLRKLRLNLENTLKETEENLINRLETEIEEEHKIYRIFKIIKKLFEKCLIKSKKPEKSPLISEAQKSPFEEEKSEKSPKAQKPTISEANNLELRKTFNILISDRSLNNVWINVTELLILINEVCPLSINLSNPVIHKMTPIIECFFIIYRILNDEESSFATQHLKSSHALRKYYARKTMPEISALIHNEVSQDPEDLDFGNFLNNREKLTFNDMFTIMCEKNKNIINMMVKQNISLLNESFSMIIKKMPKILDFDNKKNYFRSELKKLKPASYPALRLKVKRSNVFIESYNVLRNLSTEELRRKLVIEFTNEAGVDQGGLIREFYSLLSREIFNPGYCLFKTTANNVTFQPSPQSHINDQHLHFFKFVGRIFGKALHDGYMMDAFFTRSFYKHMLGQALTIYDMEDIDPEYFKNLKWILENDISGFELTFSYEADNFGKIEIFDLIPGGRNIPVTEENKLDYVQKICYAKMAKDIQEQIKKFLEGFHELIPPTLVSIFDSRELELMISGLPDIDSEFFSLFSLFSFFSLFALFQFFSHFLLFYFFYFFRFSRLFSPGFAG